LYLLLDNVIVGSDTSLAAIGSLANNESLNLFELTTDYEINGTIDQVRMYNYARTPAQIAWDYNRGAPVAWYKMNENTGTTVGNWSKNSNGAFVGNNSSLGSGSSAPTWATGKFEYALDFDGIDDYTNLSDPSDGSLDFADGQDFSIMFWAKIPNRAEADTIIAKKISNSLAAQGYLIHIFADETIGLFTSDTAQHNLTSTNTSLPIDTWTHVTMVYDDDTAVRFYFNGVNMAVTNSNTGDYTTDYAQIDSLANNAEFRIGAESGTAELFLDGTIDDVKIFNYALTAAQIKTEMNNGAVRYE
jgi:hypothetical protein